MRDGTVHPVQVGLRLVEELRMRCKDSVEEDPLEAVAVIYERELTKIKASLEGGALEEFNALCPTLLGRATRTPDGNLSTLLPSNTCYLSFHPFGKS